MRRRLSAAIWLVVLAACGATPTGPDRTIGERSIEPSASALSTPEPADGTTAHAEPSTTAPSAASYQPTAVAFWDGRAGIVGVTISSPDGSTATGELLRTSDGGRAWTRARETDGRIEQVVVAASTDAWAVVGCPSEGAADCTNLMRSTDGGATWTSTGATGVTRVTFVDARDGWGVFPGSDPFRAELRRTTDAGSTWSSAPDPCLGSRVGGLGDVAFRSATAGLAVCAGQPGAGSQLKSIVGTTDGGATWRVRASTGDFTGTTGDGRRGSIPVGGYVGLSGNVVVARDGVSWMTGGRLVPLASVDGGATWMPLGLGDSDVNLVQSAWPLDRDRGFALLWAPDRQATLLEATSDAGKTWTEVAAWPVSG